MDDVLVRFWDNLVGRVAGPLSLRLILQPLVATAVRHPRRAAGCASRQAGVLPDGIDHPAITSTCCVRAGERWSRCSSWPRSSMASTR